MYLGGLEFLFPCFYELSIAFIYEQNMNELHGNCKALLQVYEHPFLYDLLKCSFHDFSRCIFRKRFH